MAAYLEIWKNVNKTSSEARLAMQTLFARYCVAKLYITLITPRPPHTLTPALPQTTCC